MSYTFRATEVFWRKFYALRAEQKESVRASWSIFKANPFDPRLGTHIIHSLSAHAGHTIYSVRVEADLRVIFRLDGDVVTTLDVGTHAIYR